MNIEFWLAYEAGRQRAQNAAQAQQARERILQSNRPWWLKLILITIPIWLPVAMLFSFPLFAPAPKHLVNAPANVGPLRTDAAATKSPLKHEARPGRADQQRRPQAGDEIVTR